MDQIQASGGMVTLIHLVTEVSAPPSSQEGPPTLQWRIACMPNMVHTEFGKTMYHEVHHHTNDYRAVSCPACKKSQAFAAAQKAHENATKK